MVGAVAVGVLVQFPFFLSYDVIVQSNAYAFTRPEFLCKLSLKQ